MNTLPGTKVGAAATHTKSRDSWSTPPEIVAQIARYMVRTFTLDVAADGSNAVCDLYLTEWQDALAMGGSQWARLVDNENEAIWCNPPYGDLRSLTWVNACIDAARAGATVALLVPAKIDTAWWRALRRSRMVEMVLEPEGRVHFIPPQEVADMMRVEEYVKRSRMWRKDGGVWSCHGGAADNVTAALVARLEAGGLTSERTRSVSMAATLDAIADTKIQSSAPMGTWCVVLSPRGSASPRFQDLGWMSNE